MKDYSKLNKEQLIDELILLGDENLILESINKKQAKQLDLYGVVVTSCCKGTGIIKGEHNDECYCDCEIGTNLMKQQY